MDREAASALYAAQHEDAPYHNGTFTDWGKTRSTDHPYRYDEGVVIGIADHNIAPWDEFTTQVDASPIQPRDDDRPLVTSCRPSSAVTTA